ncbi:hypothetical protein C6P45_002431 [Maudiozyma exigua]|uniref:SPRY domain-containing protein n=1 Tax=Maudiozyma exigua TaxID=34358 RepID=A0A9P6VYF9_MAUEX|nr:hypothetical protein C6P45_002431 [Kazachstania exigua]
MKLGIIPYQKEDFEITDGQQRPNFQEYQSTYGGFNKPIDTPLNKRHFTYAPCAPMTLFTELGYFNTEYPFDKPGFNTMDRSDGLSMICNGNDTVGVMESMGWRTGRCDICIKEGTSYWEVEIVKGGSTIDEDSVNDPIRMKEAIDNSPHLRLGVSRRETSLEAPVGFDLYGYGVRDQAMESVHGGELMKKIVTDKKLKQGDTIGFLLTLPDGEKQIQQAKDYTLRRLQELIKNESLNPEHTGENDHVTMGPQRKKVRNSKYSLNEFQKELLRDIDYSDIVRDQIAIRYKGQLLYEATDYIKTTKPEYFSADHKNQEDYYSLKGSSLKIFVNGECLGNAFEDLNPFLPPFSELQYNEKFYYNYWKNGGSSDVTIRNHNSGINNDDMELKKEPSVVNELRNDTSNSKMDRKQILRNKYVNNNRLGYYPTVSCFNGGEAKIITVKSELKYLEQAQATTSDSIKTLDVLFNEQIADDIVLDIIDEVEEEFKKSTKS